mgnify:CR=1 FL=1
MSLKVAFVGLGYIGLPTAVVMANHGLDVTGVDVMPEKVEAINRGELTIVEPGLDSELKSALKSGRFRASTEMPRADVFILAVPTPFAENHEVDMRYINSAADSIAPVLNGGELIVLESTSPPGTTEKLASRILDKRNDLAVDGRPAEGDKPVLHFAHCPERILPGNAVEELRTNDRIIGGMSPKATEMAKSVYSTFCQGQLLETNDRTAEMAKLTENSFRDVNIAFANELSVICDQLDIDVWELIDLANHHPRVSILQPGPGVGGHCIAVDPWFIVSTAPESAKLIKMARETNDGKPRWVLDKIGAAIKQHATKSIALFGLAFKPNIDDLRESPALEIAVATASEYPEIQLSLVEPHISKLPEALSSLPNVALVDKETAIRDADLLVMLVDHEEFKNVDPEKLDNKVIINTRNIWSDLPSC